MFSLEPLTVKRRGVRLSNMTTTEDGRVLGSDAARAVGRFNADGPTGYRARSLPDGPIRATRAEAEQDEARALRGGGCSRCGGTDNVGPLPKRFPCESCGQRGLCYACNVNHNLWCAA